MKRNKIKVVSILLIILSIISIGTNLYAHSGRTDSNGGHKDNKNKSGLGSYHYHCGGNPAHLHPNGVCPYSSSSSASKSSTTSGSSTQSKSSSSSGNSTQSKSDSSSGSSTQSKSGSSSGSSTSNKNNKLNSSANTKTTVTTPTTIEATGIKINENIEKLEVGENKILTATIIPDNATNKSITWKSSNESIASISTTGELIAKKQGTVDITATSSNGKESSLKVTIEEKTEVTNNTIIKTSAISKNDNNTIDSNTNNQENSNAVAGILTLGLLGGGGAWLYKKHKK